MATPASKLRFVYKILTSRPPLPIPRTLTPIDVSDGFIHLSTAAQTPATAARFFSGESSIWLVKIDLQKLESGPGELKWEESRSHGTFAHLYGADVDESAVVEVEEKTRADGKGWEEVLSELDD